MSFTSARAGSLSNCFSTVSKRRFIYVDNPFRKITAVIPCFPYARQPDLTYSKAGIATRVDVSDQDKFNILDNHYGSSSTTPVTREFESLSLGTNETTSDTTTLENDLNFKSSREVLDEKEGKRFSISTSQPNIAVTPLKPTIPDFRPETVSNGVISNQKYRHWTARSGTLIANMLMAAGKKCKI